MPSADVPLSGSLQIGSVANASNFDRVSVDWPGDW